MREIVIKAGSVEIRARLLDTPTAARIWDALPIEASARTWGEEVYFDAPVTSAVEPGARTVVKPGEIVFWPDGEAIAIGFGPTPLSRTRAEIRLASPCNVWAETRDDVKKFRAVHAGAQVTVESV